MWVVGLPQQIHHMEKYLGTQWTEDCVDPRAGIDEVAKRKVPVGNGTPDAQPHLTLGLLQMRQS
jgi:hypothetical protein